MNAKNVQLSRVEMPEVKSRNGHECHNKAEFSDLELWSEFRAGSELAFASIYKIYVKSLYAYGLKLVRDQELVKDCIQDLFIELWDLRQKLVVVKSIKSYLFKSIRRKLLSQVSKKRKRGINVPEFESILEVTPSSEITLIEKQRFDLDRAKLYSTLQKLNNKQREIIHLKYYGRLSYDDISEIMELDKKAAYNLMAHTIKLLKGQVQLLSKF